MKQVTTISVGIPAYNEAANIKQLVQLLLAQKGSNFTLENIFVISDGSTDATVKEVLSFKDRRIHIKDDRKRLGKSARIEELLRLNTSDVLLLVDADVLIKDNFLFLKLINRFNLKNTGIAAINAQSLLPKTFFEKTLGAEVFVTKGISERWNNGDNYLSFKGCFLALSRDFAKSIHMPPHLVNNDAYLYFSAHQKGFKATYIKDCVVYYRSPKTFNDHLKQSSRYQYSQKELLPYFNNLQQEYKLPFGIAVKSMFEALYKKHIYFVSYLGTRLLTRMKKHTAVNPTWSIAGSTKQRIALTN